MSRFIEAGRNNLREQEAMWISAKEIFERTINLLRSHGQPKREAVVFKYSVIRHAVNSVKPPVNVFVRSGANLDNARKVWIHVGGHDGGLRVMKKGKVGHERFEPEAMSDGYSAYTSLDLVQEYLDTIRFLGRELEPSTVSE